MCRHADDSKHDDAFPFQPTLAALTKMPTSATFRADNFNNDCSIYSEGLHCW